MTPEEAIAWCKEAEKRGLQLMSDMGTAISESMSSPTMPSDDSILTMLIDTAKKMKDYTENALEAVNTMAAALLDAVKEAINEAITKDPKEIPTAADITAAIKTAIEKAGNN